jgi:hypothetical protein
MHEAWYASVLKGAREINIMAESVGGGCAWEFKIELRDDLGDKTAYRLSVFDDAFVAFVQIPEFFELLGESRPVTERGIIHLLERVGAVDSTDRRGPEPADDWTRVGRRLPSEVHDKLTALGWTPPGGESR